MAHKSTGKSTKGAQSNNFRIQHHRKKNQHQNFSKNDSSTMNTVSTTGTINQSIDYDTIPRGSNFFDLLDDEECDTTHARTSTIKGKIDKATHTGTKPSSSSTKPSSSSTKSPSLDTKLPSSYNSVFTSKMVTVITHNPDDNNEWSTEVAKYNKLLDNQCMELQLKPIFGWDVQEPMYVPLNKIAPVQDPSKILLPHRIAFVKTITSGVDDAQVIKILDNVLDFWFLFNSLDTRNMQFLSPTDPTKAKEANTIFHSLFEGTMPPTSQARKPMPIKDNPKIKELAKYNELHQVYALIKVPENFRDDETTIKIPCIRENGNGKALNDVNINLGTSKLITSKGIHIFNPNSFGGLLPSIIADFICGSLYDVSNSPLVVNDSKITAITFAKTITVKGDGFFNGVRLRLLLSNTLEPKLFARAFEQQCMLKYITTDNIEYNRLVCNVTPRN